MTNKMNVKLLRKVKRHILEEPKRLDMNTFVSRRMSWRPEEERPECGTVACVAGWAVLLDRIDKGKGLPRRVDNSFYMRVALNAGALLGLSYEESNRLFMFSGWPKELDHAYYAATTPRQRARVTARRIELFIKTKGAE